MAITPKNNRRHLEALEDRIRELEQKKEVIPEVKKYEDIKFHENLKVGKLYAQLPIFDALPTHNGREGEIVFVDDGTYYYICIYKDDAWRKMGEVNYVELAESGSSGVGSTSTWEDWDLSSYIPANALMADISMVNRDASEYLAGVRQNGSSQNRYMYINNDSQSIMTVNLDSGRVIERYASNANVIFAVRGYWI